MKVLSVRQPWASLIEGGRKTIELRSWTTSYRGPLVIAAASATWRGDHDYPIGPRGVVLCVVDLVDCRPATPDDAEQAGLVPPPDHYAWVLANPRPLRQIPFKGRLGIFDAPEEIRAIAG